MTGSSREDYLVGIICALSIEFAAVQAMLDDEHDELSAIESDDDNTYCTGRLLNHNVVIACLPAGIDGISAATAVVKDMRRTFPQLRFGLLVGIGGGIPNLEHNIDIRLGDIVVSLPQGERGGVVQYDKGKIGAKNRWEIKGYLNAPPKALLAALAKLQSKHERKGSSVPVYLEEMLERNPRMKEIGYNFPGRERDILYAASDAQDSLDVETSRSQIAVPRKERSSTDPQIHYGTIASGNQVIKSSAMRDSLRDQYEALCVEMEAAGLMNEFPGLVIRGVANYADKNKNDEWHRYAAATAAAFAKELLSYVSVAQTTKEKPLQQILSKQVSAIHTTCVFKAKRFA